MDTLLATVHALAWAVYVGGSITMEWVLRYAQRTMPPSQVGVVCKNAGTRYRWFALVSLLAIGASGAVFGILLAFGMLFPNTMLYVFFAIPIKAKYFVILYGLFELISGISNNPGDNVAHFAHLGGMLFGFILIKIWNKKNRQHFY